jgi:hypothetical protein
MNEGGTWSLVWRKRHKVTVLADELLDKSLAPAGARQEWLL